MAKKQEFILTGVKEIDKALKELPRKQANRVARGALTKGCQIGAKAIKAEIPSLQKNVRKAIGYLVKKGRNGITQAKFGAAGKRSSGRKKHASKGAGITTRNIHWFLLGTGDRKQNKTGKSTGAMPAFDYVMEATRKTSGAIRSGMFQRARELFDREVAKLGK